MSTPRREQCLKCGAIRPEKHGLDCPDNPDPVEPTPSPEQFEKENEESANLNKYDFAQAYADLVSKRHPRLPECVNWKEQSDPVEPTLDELLKKAKDRVMSDEEKEAQRQSWVCGEMALTESDRAETSRFPPIKRPDTCDDEINAELRSKSFAEQNEYWRGNSGKSVGSKPHNCQEYWTLKEYLESTNAPEEMRETLEQFAHFVDCRLSHYAQQLYNQRRMEPRPPVKPRKPIPPRSTYW